MQSNFAKIDDFIEEQLEVWESARTSYESLEKVRTREFIFDGHKIMAQFNPGRIVSSAAKVDPVSISKRPCFLCGQNRPAQQKGITFEKDYLILVNPYPVFQKHLTIPSIEHLPQMIMPHIEIMLQLAYELPDFTIIYNGARCGASAPDHFHFQAVAQGTLPVEGDFADGKKAVSRGFVKDCELFSWNNFLRKPLTLCGKEKGSLIGLFHKIYKTLQDLNSSAEEPMMNILMYFNKGKWIMHVFSRIKHRPDHYYANKEKQLLLSPASIDMGGFLIMPREEDFISLTPEVIRDVYSQVCIDEKSLENVIEMLMKP